MRKAIFLLLISPTASLASWFNYYDLEKQNTIPEHVHSKKYEISNTHMLVSGMHVNLNSVLSDPEIAKYSPLSIYIFADVIEVPENTKFILKNKNLFIISRTFSGPGHTTLMLEKQPTSSASISIISNTIDSDIDLVSYDDKTNDYRIDNIKDIKNSIGIMVSQKKGQHSITPIEGDLSGLLLLQNEEMLNILDYTFDTSASMYDQNPELSTNMVDWIEEVLRDSKIIKEANSHAENLYLNSVKLRQFYALNYSNESYVPYLDRSLYEATYQTYLSLLQRYNQEYIVFINKKEQLDNRRKSANMMIGTIDDIIDANSHIVTKSEQEITQIEKSIKDLEKQFESQGYSVRSAETNYRIGLDNWQRQQELQIAFQVFNSLASLGGAIAGAFVGNVEGLTKVAEDIPKAAQEMTNIANNIKSISSNIEHVTKAAEAMASLSSQVKGAIKTDELADLMANFSYDVPSIKANNDSWDVFLISMRSDLNYAHELGISGAREYLTELEILALYGKSINAAKINLAEQQSKLANLFLDIAVKQKQQKRVQELVDDIENETVIKDEDYLERYFLRGLNDAKRAMYVAIKNYIQAFEYWSLNTSNVIPSLNKEPLDYERDMALINDEYNSALTSFNPTPQPFSNNIIKITDKSKIEKFKEAKETIINIDLNHKNFKHFDRTRLKTVRAFLNGKNMEKGIEYSIEIENNGNYRDKLKSKEHQFNSTPLYRAFKYIPGYLSNNITTDGEVSDSFKFAYFEPTPFTTWSIRLKTPDIDLKSLESISIEFEGEYIPNRY